MVGKHVPKFRAVKRQISFQYHMSQKKKGNVCSPSDAHLKKVSTCASLIMGCFGRFYLISMKLFLSKTFTRFLREKRTQQLENASPRKPLAQDKNKTSIFELLFFDFHKDSV